MHKKSRTRRRLLTGLAAISLMVAGVVGLTGPAYSTVSDDSGFESADGNLAPEPTINFDWNSFATVEWDEGDAPYRQAREAAGGWDFTGIEDAQVTTSDSAFSGGTKQDDDCATLKDGKAPNKDDLKRIYVSSSTVGGDVFLNLAWVRIPQNTTSASAHIGFEFNSGTTPCGAGSGDLVEREAGDMLIVYDFEGGTDEPTITLRRWTETAADSCEVGSNSPPCWGVKQDLTAGGFADAKVNTGGSVNDLLAPPAEPATTSISQSLAASEFGEAGINLTDAGVFQENTCTAFGNAFGVSRSSGNSATAQMKDLVGPGDVNISNCGTVIIRKVTDPSPDPTDTSFGYTATGGLDPATFSLKNGEARNYGGEVQAGTYSVTEDDPSSDNFALTDIDCDASTAPGSAINIDVASRTVTFDLGADETVDCTFTNTLQTGAIEITKTRKHAEATDPANDPHAGVTFTVEGGNLPSGGASEDTDVNGKICMDGLTFGDYTVSETVPAGYEADKTSDTVTVDAASTCGDGNEAKVSFVNTPLTDVQVSVDSQVPGGTASTIECTDADGNVYSASTTTGGDGSLDVTDLLPTDPTVTLTCEITIDP